MKPTVFIHANDRQPAGAVGARRSLGRRSARPEPVEPCMPRRAELPGFAGCEGRRVQRAGARRVRRNDDPRSVAPSEATGLEGRAVGVDPDVFAVGDGMELLERDMQGGAILAPSRPGHNGRPRRLAAGVALPGCASLTHRRRTDDFGRMWRGAVDCEDRIVPSESPRETLGEPETVLNDVDRLYPDTRRPQDAERRSQPRKSGPPAGRMVVIRRFGPDASMGLSGRRKPDAASRQAAPSFARLAGCPEADRITESAPRAAIAAERPRPDAQDLARAARRAEAVLDGLAEAA